MQNVSLSTCAHLCFNVQQYLFRIYERSMSLYFVALLSCCKCTVTLILYRYFPSVHFWPFTSATILLYYCKWTETVEQLSILHLYTAVIVIQIPYRRLPSTSGYIHYHYCQHDSPDKCTVSIYTALYSLFYTSINTGEITVYCSSQLIHSLVLTATRLHCGIIMPSAKKQS